MSADPIRFCASDRRRPLACTIRPRAQAAGTGVKYLPARTRTQRARTAVAAARPSAARPSRTDGMARIDFRFQYDSSWTTIVYCIDFKNIPRSPVNPKTLLLRFCEVAACAYVNVRFFTVHTRYEFLIYRSFLLCLSRGAFKIIIIRTNYTYIVFSKKTFDISFEIAGININHDLFFIMILVLTR